MKMTFCAVFLVCTGVEETTCAAGKRGITKDPASPAPANWKKWRRLRCGRSRKVAVGWGRRLISLRNLSCPCIVSFRASIVENEIHFVEQHPEQIFRRLRPGAHLEPRHGL